MKFGTFKFTNSPEAADFLGPSKENINIYKREEVGDMIQSKRTTRNMLQSINIYDYIPSQDNLFNSQLSGMSAMMGSHRSVRSVRSNKDSCQQ